MSEIVSLLPSAIAAAGIVAGGLNLYAGLLILSLIGPFFTILHEASPGSPIFFLWPFALCGSMAVSILSRESFSKNSLLPEGERRVFSRLTIVVIAGAVSTLFWIGKDAMSIVLDVQMIEFRKILIRVDFRKQLQFLQVCLQKKNGFPRSKQEGDYDRRRYRYESAMVEYLRRILHILQIQLTS